MSVKSITHRFGGDGPWDLTISMDEDNISYTLKMPGSIFMRTITRAEYTGPLSPLSRPGCITLETRDTAEVTYSGMNPETGKSEKDRQFHVMLTRRL